MTWKSHCLANGAVTLALTCRVDIALAAMATAVLPDQLEAFLPLGRHRGASHWVLLWLVVVVALPIYLHRKWIGWTAALPWHHFKAMPGVEFALGAAVFGMALGPLLHVLFDGCSSSGVPVAPFSRTRLKLSLYKTRNRRACLDFSELLFLAAVLTVCALSWKARG